MSRPFLQPAVGDAWGWHSIGLQPMWDSHVSLPWTTHIHTIPKGQWWGQDRLPRLGAHGCTLPVTGPLPSPYYAWRHAIRLYRAPALHVSCGWHPLLVPASVSTPEWLEQPPFLFHELPIWDACRPTLIQKMGFWLSEVAWRWPLSR